MPISKVNRNYQVTIPKEVRQKAKIGKGDSVLVEFDEKEEIVKLTPPTRGKRKTWKFGSKLTVERIESSIERGQSLS
ncbi:MAG: AbrB/MazE/SpoVT family DNA-binding domain-containing protein [Nitrososphaerales archaeon]